MKAKKQIIKTAKYVSVLFSEYSCVLIGRFFYQSGFVSDIIIILLAMIFALLGYAVTQKIHSMLFLHINLLLSVFIGTNCSTKEYFLNIHSDQMSLVIGLYFSIGAIILTLIAVTILLIVRIFKRKENKTNISSNV